MVVAAHTAYRLGYRAEENIFAGQIDTLSRQLKSPFLEANICAYRHLRDIRGGHSLRALELHRRKENVAMGANGIGRLFVYAVETFLHRKCELTKAPAELGMPLEVALRIAHEMAIDAKDYDAAMRFRTVLIRAHLWSGDWEAALGVAAKVWSDMAALGLDVPHAAMRLSYEEYVAHRMAEQAGTKAADANAEAALAKSLVFAKQAGNAPILSDSHKREYSDLGKSIKIFDLDLGN